MKTYAVIGDPIDRSLSPAIHNAAFRELGMECTYIAYRIASGELAEGVESLRKIGISGFNVTVPHKMAMMDYLDEADGDCSMIGAVNTVTNSGGALKGYNTDMDGFLDPIRRRGIGTDGASVLLLGAGGAARAIVAAFAKAGAGEISIMNRTPERAHELAAFARKAGVRASHSGYDGMREAAAGCSFIVNATPAGYGGGPSPVPADIIPTDCTVYDIVYAPMKTGLVKNARERGAGVIYGYEMLLGQACRAFEIWHGMEAPYGAMKRALLGGA